MPVDREASVNPPRKLPPDAPHGAVDQLNGGIFVDANGQEVKKVPVAPPTPTPTPDQPPKEG